MTTEKQFCCGSGENIKNINVEIQIMKEGQRQRVMTVAEVTTKQKNQGVGPAGPAVLSFLLCSSSLCNFCCIGFIIHVNLFITFVSSICTILVFSLGNLSSLLLIRQFQCFCSFITQQHAVKVPIHQRGR